MMQKGIEVHNSRMRQFTAPGVCRLQIPFSPDHTMDLPPSFANADTSKVKFMTMDDAAAAMQRYEGVVRHELGTTSEFDRVCALPDSKSHYLYFDGLLTTVTVSCALRIVLLGLQLVL